MPEYLVTLTPLEPYFFGGERSFSYGTRTTAPDTYFISSEKTPNQTALLGALRYALLDMEGLLWHKGERGECARRRSELVGRRSFSIEGENDFGVIGELSPLFLRKGETNYIPTPANYGIAEGGLRFENLMSSNGPAGEQEAKRVPANYKAKGHALPDGAYLPISGEITETDPFYRDVRVGINIRQRKDAFFKKNYCMLKEGFSFAFYAALAESLRMDGYSGIVFMGKGKSPFQISFRQEDNHLEDEVRELLPREENDYWYALSDLWISEKPDRQNGFAILMRKQMRYLTTNLGSETQRNRFSKSEVLFNLVQAGSVFYYDPSALKLYPEARKIGMNRIVRVAKSD